MKKIFFLVLFTVALLLPGKILARDANQITDWYVKDFSSDIIVNLDSSLLITEKIIADCGNLSGKHGIVRAVPTFYKTDDETIYTPIKLISITNLQGQSWDYNEIENDRERTVTWQIGSPDQTLTGVNYFIIKYQVQNTIRFNNEKFDEFYWDLNGNYSVIDVDHFSAIITFPDGVTKNNSEGWLYGPDNKSLDFSWDKNRVVIDYNKILAPHSGLTFSLIFPKKIISPYESPVKDKYGLLLWWSIPILFFIFCFVMWLKFGRDPHLHKTIVPQFEIPDNLSPLTMGAFINNGSVKTEYISAAIAHLAVKKKLTIEEIPKKWFFGKKDYKLVLLSDKKSIDNASEKVLAYSLFADKNEVEISSLKDKFNQKISEIQQAAKDELMEKNLFYKHSFTLQTVFLTIGIIIMIFSFVILAQIFGPLRALSVGITGLIFFVFSFFMSKMTDKGIDLNWRIKGFELYLKTAEKFRQQFNDKEGIFEKFLPYAMLFGLTKLWIEKMKEIYGEEYYNTYRPTWFLGSSDANFNFYSFNASIASLSESISMSASSSGSGSSSSGSSGGGFSGGGGGGGGVGGW